ncbi:hypothetical protein V494_06444, partial [Pseudogymnoascus sp. VKM F-4513 (FW-928)]
MTSNNYNYGGNYPPINKRAPTSQQSFATSSATAGDPYYGQQPAATSTRTYPNNDYQYQQYPQQASANNGSGYNFGVYSGGNATPTTGMESLGNPGLPEPTPSTTTKSNAHNSYDTTGLGNLAYASGLSYNSGAETVQSTTRYSGGSVYEGSGRSSVAHQSTPSQGHDRTRPDNSGSRASPATGMHMQRHIPEQSSGIKSGTAYNLPTPSPAYPPSLINSYPQRSANTTMPTGGTPVGSRASEASSGNVQSQYSPFTPSQPQKPATTRVFKQNQNRQTSTPPAAPVSRSTANASSNAYSNQPRSQAGRRPNSQSGRAIQTSPPPATTLPPAKMSANVTRRTGEGQMPTTQNINSQANQYQPAPAPAPQLPPTSNYLPLPTQVSTARNQQLPQPQPQPQRRPSPDRPTTVDPSHVYNSYHEYQKQIEAAEAEAARLAKLKEVAALDEQRRQELLRAQQQREREHMTGPAVQAAMTLAHTMPGDNAPESESVSEESDEDEQGQPSGGSSENKEQQATSAATSENISHQMAAGSVDPKGKAPSMPVPTTEPHEPPKDNTAVTMEEEMRRMVEKLRDYQSKDPKLFLQVWSSVRKTNTGQSPQPQAEGSQTQGSPVAQSSEGSLKSPTPAPATNATMAGPTPVPAPKATVAGPTPVPAPKATMVSTTPVPVPVPPPASKGKKAAVQSPASTKSPSTQAAAEAREVANAKRRPKRASRSKAAKAERAAAELAEAKAKVDAAAASAAIPAAREPTLVTPSKPGAPGSGGNSKPTTSTPRSTSIVPPPQKTSSSIATPAATNHAAANSRPANGTQQTPAGPSQVTGGVQRPSPAANTAPSRQAATWPTDKRDAIAITAASVLNEIPENAGKKILSRQIRNMLEGNPSYLELCEMIEKLGFRMDRARFAKTLLSILPGGSKPRPQPHPAAVTSTPGQTASVTAVIPPVTPGTTQTPSQTGQAPGSGTSMNGIERRPVGRPRKDGLPPGSPHGGDSRTGCGPGRSQKPVPPAEIAEGPPNATATAATTAADTPASVATALPNAPSQPPLHTAVTTASPNAPGKQTETRPPPAPATTATSDAEGLQSQSHPAPSSGTAPPSAPGQPNAPPVSQGQEGSAPLTTEEAQQMSLLQAYVGKPWRVSKPEGAEGEAAGSYTSPYANKVVAPPKGGWKTWRDLPTASTMATTTATKTATGQTYPYTPHPNIYSPTAVGPGPGPPVHHNPPPGTFTGPPQYGLPPPGPPHPVPPQYGPPQHTQFQPAAYPYHHHGKKVPPPPTQYGPPPDTQFQAERYPYHRHGNAAPNAPAVPEAPLTKEAQARKRTFAEIIDLTKGESSDKGEGNNEKRQRVDAGERTNNLSDMHGPDPPTTGELPTRPTQPKPVPFQHHHNQFTNTQSQNNVSNVIDNPQVPVTRNPLLEYDGIVKSIDRSLALRKSRYDPKTIARDILISAGKHPAQRSLNGHLKQLKEKFTKVDNTSDLSTFRWDIVDPGGAAVGSANMPPYGPNNTIKYPVPLTEAVPGRCDPSRPSGLRNETSNFAIVIRDGDGDEDDETPDHPAPAPKRRGRPPRDPNAAKATPQRVLTRRNRGTPNNPVVPGEEEIELPPPKRRGRPAKEKAPERPLSRLSQPRYIPFLCEWRGCKAELMNLETLRKHVYVVHGKIISSKDFEAKPCLFAKCGKKSASNAGDVEGDVEMGGVQQEEIYVDEEGFRAHMEKAHIIPIAWHLGDGPRGTTLDGNESDRTSYLNSPLTGRPITPSIAFQTVSDTLPRRRARAPRSTKPWTQWEYWCKPGYKLKSALRRGEVES